MEKMEFTKSGNRIRKHFKWEIMGPMKVLHTTNTINTITHHCL